MKLKVQHVDPKHIHHVWPLVKPWFEAVFENSSLGEQYSIDNIKDYIIRGEYTLVVVSDDEGVIHGAISLRWINSPHSRIALVVAIGGKLISSKEAHQEFVNWVRAMGGTKIQGYAKESVARLWKQKLGYTPAHIVMELNV
jgi:hypothetical protein